MDLPTRKLDLNFTCHIIAVPLWKVLDASKIPFFSKTEINNAFLPLSSAGKGTKINTT